MKSEMQPIKETIPLDEARQLIADACTPIERTERIPIVDANGRAAAADVASTRDVPPFSRAGMDGFAVRAEDTFGASRYEPKTLRVIEKVYTGQVPSRTVESGTAVEIATGAPMPPGADAVVMVEETEQSGGDVRVLTPVYPRQNVGRQGADIVVGQTVIARGDVLNPSRIGALAALGISEVEVFAKPTVAILSTGNEIADPGAELKPGQIYDINKFTLSTIIAEHGGVPMPFATAPPADRARLVAAHWAQQRLWSASAVQPLVQPGAPFHAFETGIRKSAFLADRLRRQHRPHRHQRQLDELERADRLGVGILDAELQIALRAVGADRAGNRGSDQ